MNTAAMLMASGAFNLTAITAANWFVPFIIGVFVGMFIRKFF